MNPKNDYQFNDSQLGQQKAYCEPTPTDPYALHQMAVAEWHEACFAYQQSAQRKEKASRQLAEATKRLGELLQSAQLDPSNQVPERPINGLAGMSLSGSYPR